MNLLNNDVREKMHEEVHLRKTKCSFYSISFVKRFLNYFISFSGHVARKRRINYENLT